MIGVTVAVAAFALVIIVLAFSLSPESATDEAARLQALAAAGGLLASIVLIFVTSVYVILTGDMVREARETRLDAVRPHLAMRIDPVGSVNTVFTLVNAGQGTALDVDVTIAFHPTQPGGHKHEAQWRSPSLAPGDFAQFMPKNAAGQVELVTKTLVDLFERVTVGGAMKDAAGRNHPVDVVLDDLPGWQALLAGASQRYLEPAPERIARALEKIQAQLP